MFQVKVSPTESLKENFENRPGKVISHPIMKKMTSVAHLSCPVHGKSISSERVVIQDTSGTSTTIELVGFCCKTFKNDVLAGLNG